MKSPSNFLLIPPFEKGGLGEIFATRTIKSPMIPLSQRGKWNSPSLTTTKHPSFPRRRESRFIAGEPKAKMDTGLHRYDRRGFGAEEK
jgi:hypothetical protein